MYKPKDFVRGLIEEQEEKVQDLDRKLKEQQFEIESQLENILFFKRKRGKR